MANNDKSNQYSSPVGAIFTGIGDLFRQSGNKLNLEGLPSLEGKQVLITGASSGLGFAAAVEMARRGARVIMAQRSGIPGKGEEVKKKSGSEKVEMISLDLSDLASLEGFTKELIEKFGPLDIIICNAAMVAKNGRALKEGLDQMFVVNYFAKFLLARELEKGKLLNYGGAELPRIIFVASESHRNPKDFEWDKFGRFEPYGIKQSVAMYGYYKLLLLTMVSELNRRINPDGKVKASVFALCPGPVNSNIAREAPKIFHPLLKLVFGIFFRSPKKACGPVVYLAASRDVEAQSGNYMFLMQNREMDEKATDPQNGKKLWELSEKLEIQTLI